MIVALPNDSFSYNLWRDRQRRDKKGIIEFRQASLAIISKRTIVTSCLYFCGKDCYHLHMARMNNSLLPLSSASRAKRVVCRRPCWLTLPCR